jgi:hypothetical protein
MSKFPWSIVAMNRAVGGVSGWKVVGDESVQAEEYVVVAAHASVGKIYRQADAKKLRAMISAADPMKIPLSAQTPHCVSAGCNDNAHGWLVAPDGLVVPGGAYCRRHLFNMIDQYAAKAAETWMIAPLLFPCQHSCDPRLCAEQACSAKRSDLRTALGR